MATLSKSIAVVFTVNLLATVTVAALVSESYATEERAAQAALLDPFCALSVEELLFMPVLRGRVAPVPGIEGKYIVRWLDGMDYAVLLVTFDEGDVCLGDWSELGMEV